HEIISNRYTHNWLWIINILRNLQNIIENFPMREVDV
ncbi:uncharacterized protein METZ01_LOCUS451843, partial [marine metagenome]